MTAAEKNAIAKEINKQMINPENPSGSVAGTSRATKGQRRRVEGDAEAERRAQDEGRSEGARKGSAAKGEQVIPYFGILQWRGGAHASRPVCLAFALRPLDPRSGPRGQSKMET